MKKIIYQEFGVRTEITKYKEIGNRLKGMREGKPFLSDYNIKVNIGEKVYIVEEVNFFDIKGKVLQRKDVCLDTEHRVAGIIVNSKKEVLLLEINGNKHFFCFPGGHQRECETESNCLEREMLEETGIDIVGSQITLLLKMQQDGFGPETFYLIDIGDKQIKFKEEVLEDDKSKLRLYPIEKLRSLQDVFPAAVLNKLISIYDEK